MNCVVSLLTEGLRILKTLMKMKLWLITSNLKGKQRLGILSWRCICESFCVCSRKTVKHIKTLYMTFCTLNKWYCFISLTIPCLPETFPDLSPMLVNLCCSVADKIFIKKRVSESPPSFKCAVSLCFSQSSPWSPAFLVLPGMNDGAHVGVYLWLLPCL